MEIGIQKLDEMLGGYIPAGKSLVFYGHPCADIEVFGIQTIFINLNRGTTDIFLITIRPDITNLFKEFGWDIDQFKNRFTIVDLNNFSSDNIMEFSRTIEKVLKTSNRSTIVFDSLSFVMDLYGEKETINAVNQWNKIASEYSHVIVYTFLEGSYSEKTLELIRDDLFNAVVSIGEIAGHVGQYFRITKADWTKEKKNPILFRCLRPGGIRIFIPKILLSWSNDLELCKITLSCHRGDMGRVDIFGLPQKKFEPVIKLLCSELFCVLFIMDSLDTKNSNQKRQLEIIRNYGVPCIVITDIQSTTGDLAPTEIKRNLNLPEDVIIISVRSIKNMDLKDIVEKYLDGITRGNGIGKFLNNRKLG